MAINEFQGEYRFLSNFWFASVQYDGVFYPSVEHAFVAAKTLSPIEREKVQLTRYPGAVKKLGRSFTLRKDWDEVKLGIMYDLVEQKFMQHLQLGIKLTQTAPQELIEGNYWGDVFWGVCRGVGENHLGKILMHVRDKIIASNIHENGG